MLNLIMSSILRVEELLEQSYFTGACPCLPQATVLRHVVVLMLLPLPQFLRNVVIELALEGRNAMS